MRELQSGQIDFGIGAIDSSLPAALQIYPRVKIRLWRCCTVTIRWQTSRTCRGNFSPDAILRCSRRNIQRLVGALAESHRLTLNTRFQVDYIETLYGLVRSRLAIAILPELYTTHLQDPVLKIAQLQQPALARTVALMRGPRQRRR